MNASRQPRLDCLEIAAAALALRVARREKLGGMKPKDFVGLKNKLEKCRRRAARAYERLAGRPRYQKLSARWSDFLSWAHYNIIKVQPRRRPSPGNQRYREQREETRKLVLRLVVESADRQLVCHLADLARRELRRGRHGIRLRELLADCERAVQFFTLFLMKRLGPEVVKPEFQPDGMRASALSEKAAQFLSIPA